MSLEQKNEIVLYNGEKFEDHIVKVYSGKICDKNVYEFELKYNFRDEKSVDFNEEGIGYLSFKGVNYRVQVQGSNNPQERRAILTPINRK